VSRDVLKRVVRVDKTPGRRRQAFAEERGHIEAFLSQEHTDSIEDYELPFDTLEHNSPSFVDTPDESIPKP
jgi:hypothetical protein